MTVNKLNQPRIRLAGRWRRAAGRSRACCTGRLTRIFLIGVYEDLKLDVGPGADPGLISFFCRNTFLIVVSLTGTSTRRYNLVFSQDDCFVVFHLKEPCRSATSVLQICDESQALGTDDERRLRTPGKIQFFGGDGIWAEGHLEVARLVWGGDSGNIHQKPRRWYIAGPCCSQFGVGNARVFLIIDHHTWQSPAANNQGCEILWWRWQVLDVAGTRSLFVKAAVMCQSALKGTRT